MIRPSRHMDLETAPIRLATLVLEELREATALRLSDVHSMVSQNVRGDVKRSLSVALQLLFLMGLIEYDPASDAVIWITGDASE